MADQEVEIAVLTHEEFRLPKVKSDDLKNFEVIDPLPDEDDVLLCVHANFYDPLDYPALFSLKKGETGISTDWSARSTPEESQMRRKKPELNAVARMNIGAVRQCITHVKHDPVQPGCPDIEPNEAHSEIRPIPPKKKLDPEIRLALSRLLEKTNDWAWPIRLRTDAAS